MDFLFPLTAVVSEATGKTIDKLNFRKNRIAPMLLMRLVFIGMSFWLLLYILLAGKPLPDFSFIAAGLMLTIAFVSFIGNVFDTLSLKADDLSLREPMIGFEPILAGFVGYLLFPTERKSGFLLAFALSAVVVYLGTHRRKLRVRQGKGMFYLFLAVIFYSTLPSIYKWTLDYINPEYISLFRVISILILASFFFPVQRRKHSPKKVFYALASGFAYAIGAVASLYAIQKLGVIQTMLLLLLGPSLKYFASWFILREKVRKGELASSATLAVIVLVSIAL